MTKENGMALVELVFVVFILFLVTYLFLKAFIPSVQLFGRINSRTELLQRGVLAVNKLSRDLRMAVPGSISIVRHDGFAPVKGVKGIAFLRLNEQTPYNSDTNKLQWEAGYTVYCLDQDGKFYNKFVNTTLMQAIPMDKLKLEETCNEQTDKRILTKDVTAFNLYSVSGLPLENFEKTIKLMLVLENNLSSRYNKGKVELETAVYTNTEG